MEYSNPFTLLMKAKYFIVDKVLPMNKAVFHSNYHTKACDTKGDREITSVKGSKYKLKIARVIEAKIRLLFKDAAVKTKLGSLKGSSIVLENRQ